MERNSRNIKIGYGIPTYNRYDLLKGNLLLYARDFSLSLSNTEFYIIDNGNQNVAFNYSTIIKNEKNIGVGASWNQLCEIIFESCTHAVILNDDIYLGKREHEVISLITKKPESLIRASIDWSAFIIPKTLYEEVGRFDECFYPAYYEDRSYEYRMKLSGAHMYKTPELIPYEYRNSSSLEKDPSILEWSKKNKSLYIEMWGGEPEREKYKTPFNKPL
jgi:GT2 family glycosyltransferase